jgi:general secretion pathway protein C
VRQIPRFSITSTGLVHAAGAGLAMASLCFWASQWPDPPTPSSPATAQPLPADDGTGQALAAWLGPGEVRLHVALLGLARRSDHAVALLSIHGAAPRPYLAGEHLLPNVRLLAIEADGVVLEHAGRTLRLAAPARPAPASAGIVPVR